MKKFIKMIVSRTLKAFNLKLSFYDKSKPRYIKIVDSLDVNVIFDIGANSGRFALEVLQNGFRGKIISFEPTSKIYETLHSNSKKFSNWVVHERTAVGDRLGTIMINVAGNSAASSSVLSMRRTHQEAVPEANFVSSETVPLITLDSVFHQYTSGKSKCLLKIDVQGYEEQVLTGALTSLKEIDVVKLECSLVSLYEGDKTFDFYFEFFKANGFELFDIKAGLTNPVTGRLLQFDAVFVKNI